MDKPVIITCGVPHSFTSMTNKFLMDNGGYCDDLWDNPEYKMGYSRFESKELQDFLEAKRKFKKKELTDFFDSLPTDKVITLKAPTLIMFINEMKEYTNRRIKVVFCFRNPEDIILSSMAKGKKKSFIYHFEMISWIYRFLAEADYPVFPLVTERLLRRDPDTAKSLLDFAELDSSNINYASLDKGKTKDRKTTYLKYRFANFFWKRLAVFFKAI